ncbi:MAG: DegV family protein [Eubacteriales bacterium]
MRDYIIVTDSDTELPYEYAEENKIPVFLMPYTIDNDEKLYDLGKDEKVEKEFYKKLREGATATTSTRPPVDIANFYKEQLDKGLDILYLCFSSELSGHYNLSCMAAEEILAEYPDARLEVVDTKSISMPAGLIVMKAIDLKNQGKSLDEVLKWVEDNKNKATAWFAVDDLGFLKRGGRLSGSQAFLGTLLDIKPILTINEEGKIVNIDKLNGLNKVKRYMVEKVAEFLESPDSPVYILHADCEDVAADLKNKILEKTQAKDVRIKMVGPVIGSHAGPGTLAVVYFRK